MGYYKFDTSLPLLDSKKARKIIENKWAGENIYIDESCFAFECKVGVGEDFELIQKEIIETMIDNGVVDLIKMMKYVNEDGDDKYAKSIWSYVYPVDIDPIAELDVDKYTTELKAKIQTQIDINKLQKKGQ